MAFVFALGPFRDAWAALGPRQILLASFRTDGHCSHLGFSKRKENRMTEREQRRLVNQRLAAVQHAEG